MADDQWSLKILSGLHSGAESALEPGTYTLGCHEECDFVLTDSQLAERQCEIVIAESGITIKSLSEQHDILLDGEHAGQSCTPQKHQIVTVAGINFAFGMEGEPWPSPESSGQPSFQKTKAASPRSQTKTKAEAAPEQTNQSDSGKDSANGHDTPTDNSASPQKKRAFSYWPGHGFFKKSLYHYRWLATGILSIALMAVLIFSFLWLWKKTSPDDSVRPVNYFRMAESIVHDMELPDIHIRQLGDGSIAIKGYISDDNMKSALQEALEKQNVPARLELTTISGMLSTAREVLRRNGYTDLKLMPDTTPGALVLSGYAVNAKRTAVVRNLLITEVPGLLSLVEQMEYQITREKDLGSLLKEQGLGSKVRISSHDNKVLLSGRLNDVSEGYRFRKVVSQFRHQHGNSPELVIDVTIPSTNISTLGPRLDIKSISLGHTPYIMLGNGEKYLSGARLENGYILESIGLEYLILSLGQQRIKYYVRPHDE